jgi:hypothetical protein
MTFLYFLADLFINTFGITQPTRQQRRRAALFILGLMVVVVAGVTAFFFVAHSAMK